MKPLSERLEDYAPTVERYGLVRPHSRSSLAELLREAAELARRVEAGPREKVTHWEQAAFAKAGVPIPDEGSYVRIVPEPQEVPDA